MEKEKKQYEHLFHLSIFGEKLTLINGTAAARVERLHTKHHYGFALISH